MAATPWRSSDVGARGRHPAADRRYFDVDRLVDCIGNMPPELILQSCEMLRPASRAISQVQLWENIWNDEFV